MRLPAFTVTRKVAAGYLLVACFSLVALVFALTSLRAQTERSERLVAVDFKALNLARNLRQNVLAHETLQRQAVILQDDAILDLLIRREKEFEELWAQLSALPLPDLMASLTPLERRFLRESSRCRELLRARDWSGAELCLQQTLGPLHAELVDHLERFATGQQEVLDEALAGFSEQSARAYRITLALAFLGIGLSAPVAMTIILSIHRSIGALVRAAQEFAAGSFDHPIPLKRRDEFGLLAREFSDMARKLRELEQLSLDANPLTYLPGNLALDREIEARLRAGVPFAHLYIDLDHFKAYNDRYGYRAGSEIIARVADLLQAVVAELGSPEDLVAHIGGDDFVILAASLERAEDLAREIIGRFDRLVPGFYTEEDRQAGSFEGKDRFGELRRFSLMTLSVAIVWSGHLDAPSVQTISRECVQMKEHLKTLPGSNYLIDRRRRP